MYCTQCGSDIPDDAKFCPFCAELVVRSTSSQIQPPQPPQPSQPSFQPTPISKPKSSNATAAVILVVITVLIIGSLLLYFGVNMMYAVPGTGITMLVIGAIVIICIGCSVCSGCGTGRRRRSYGGGDCSGCDCSGCDCDCGGCDC